MFGFGMILSPALGPARLGQNLFVSYLLRASLRAVQPTQIQVLLVKFSLGGVVRVTRPAVNLRAYRRRDTQISRASHVKYENA